MSESEEFLQLFEAYAVELSEFIHGNAKEHDDVIRMAANTAMIYSLPFYARHAEALRPVALDIHNDMAYGRMVDMTAMREAVADLKVG